MEEKCMACECPCEIHLVHTHHHHGERSSGISKETIEEKVKGKCPYCGHIHNPDGKCDCGCKM